MVGELVTPLLKKSFSRDEKTFYNLLANGIDENISYTLSWLKTHEADLLLDAEDEDEFDELFAASVLHTELNNRIQDNTLNGIQPLSRFYKVGSRLGYYELKRDQHYDKRDKEALSILNQYVGDTIYSVNVDSCLGIKDILMMGALGGLALSKISDNILKSPYTITPHSGATVDTRCTMIATTEYGRSVNTGLLQAYVNNGVYTVDIKTAGDDRVCSDCLDIEANNPYTIEEAMGLLPVHSNCYDDKTEVFTDKGWKLFKDVNPNDKILSLNPDTMETVFLSYVTKIMHMNTFTHMYHVFNDYIDFCVTPDHDCFLFEYGEPRFSKPNVLPLRGEFLINHETNNKTLVNECNIKLVEYSGMVYCLELPMYHTLFTRRDGKTVWNGNCRCSISSGNYPLADPSLMDDFIVNMTDNDYNLSNTTSGSGSHYDFTFNGF